MGGRKQGRGAAGGRRRERSRRFRTGFVLVAALLPAALSLPDELSAGTFGGPVLAQTPRNSVGSPLAFPENPRRDLALQDDGSLWVADPTSRFITVFHLMDGTRENLELDSSIPTASADSPLDGLVGLCPVPGAASHANHVLLRAPTPRIAMVELNGRVLELSAPFQEVQGLPPGAFLTGLDRHPTEPEILTLDDAGRLAIFLDLDYQVVRQVKLLGDENPLSGAGIAYLDDGSFVAGTSFGRPFSLNLLLQYDRVSSLYTGTAISLDALPGAIAGGLEVGPFGATAEAVYGYNVPEDQVVVVESRRAAAPPPPGFTVSQIDAGQNYRFQFTVDPAYGIDEVLVRENGVEIGSAPPGGSFDLRGAVGTSALEFEARSGGLPGPLAVPLHLFSGDWIPGLDSHQRFLAIPFDQNAAEFDPRDSLSGLALDWKGNRAESRLYVATRRSQTIRIYSGEGDAVGSFDHRYPAAATAGLALAPERDGRGRPLLMLLDQGSPPPAESGLPLWAKIDLDGTVVAQGPLEVSLLGGPGPPGLDFGDWDDDGHGGYVAFEQVSKRVCAIDGKTMAVVAAVAAPPAYLGPAGSPAPAGSAAVLPSGLVLVAGGAAGAALATDAYLLTSPAGPGGGLFTGFALSIPDLGAFRVRFCADGSAVGCPLALISLPGVGFSGISGLEAAYEESTGYDLAYFLTPDAVLFRYFDGQAERASTVSTQGFLTRTGARSSPELDGEQLFDGPLDLQPLGAAATPARGTRLAAGGKCSFFAWVINDSGEELRLETRLVLDGLEESPAILERVTLPPGTNWRRQADSPGRSTFSLGLRELAGKSGRARVILGVVGTRSAAARFRRGDVDGGGSLDLTDPVLILEHLFLGGAAPACPDAADADDGGTLDLSDAVVLLQHLFLGGPPPPPPGPTLCGPDPTEDSLPACVDPACAG